MSHAGVRSDLFRRPLDQTYITDFFGGVSQAEVMSPPLSLSPSSNEGSEPENVPESELPVELDQSLDFTSWISSDTNATVRSADEVYGYDGILHELNSRAHAPKQGENMQSVRAWVSTGLLVALVGWVGSKTT